MIERRDVVRVRAALNSRVIPQLDALLTEIGTGEPTEAQCLEALKIADEGRTALGQLEAIKRLTDAKDEADRSIGEYRR